MIALFQPNDHYATRPPAADRRTGPVAERLCRYADLVGRERVIAGTDCGFRTFAGFGPVDPDIAYLKLGSRVQGAEIASARLWE